MRELKDFTEKEFKKLKKSGFLWEFYPDAPNKYCDIEGVYYEPNIDKIGHSNNNIKRIVEMVRSNTRRYMISYFHRISPSGMDRRTCERLINTICADIIEYIGYRRPDYERNDERS